MSRETSPNILLFVTDQHRFDALGSVNSQMVSPNLNALEDNGVFFSNAYSCCGLCTPARGSILTGLRPYDHGLMTNHDHYHALRSEIHDGVVGLGTYLRNAGWNCGYVGKWHVGTRKLPSTFGFEGMEIPGYGFIDQYEPYRKYLKDRGFDLPKPVGERFGPPGMAAAMSGPVKASRPYYLAEYTIDLLKRFAREPKTSGKPFLIWTNFWGPHGAYLCCEPYASIYDPKRIEPWPNYEDEHAGKPMIHRRFVETNFESSCKATWEHWRELVARYWGMVTQIDDQLGRILSELDTLGLAENTLIVFTADHGDMIGAHGGIYDKGPFMYEEVYHIPMLLRWPAKARAGTRCDRFVSLLDLVPTFLDAAGVEEPCGLAGRSLVPLIAKGRAAPAELTAAGEETDGTGKESDWPDYFVAEWHGHRFLYSQRMIRWRSYKYVFNPGDIDELYDLEKDPFEMNNLCQSKDHGEVKEQLQRKLMHHMMESRDPLRGAGFFMLPGAENTDKWELIYPYHLEGSTNV